MALPGFSSGNESKGTTIYCAFASREDDDRKKWYIRENDKSVCIEEPVLIGKIVEVERWTKKSDEYEDAEKLTFRVDVDDDGEPEYALVCGAFSAFAKCMIGALATAPKETLAKSIKIMSRNRNKAGFNKALMCSLYDGSGEWMPGMTDWDTHDWDALIEMAMSKINGSPIGEEAKANADDFRQQIRSAKSLTELQAIKLAIESSQDTLGPTYSMLKEQVDKAIADFTAGMGDAPAPTKAQFNEAFAASGLTKKALVAFTTEQFAKARWDDLNNDEKGQLIVHLNSLVKNEAEDLAELPF